MSRAFQNYTIAPVRDERTDDMSGYTKYAVIAHDGIVITDSGGWELPDQKVLFTTERDAFDGGRAECVAFIEGYKSALPVIPPTYVGSSA